ncbi:hypothetical protein AXF21_02945 [Eubacterium minutum ATCC 700079]|nr:hypothetical protein AXF21_02945 [Eubacterium minutum ATCC 700079]
MEVDILKETLNILKKDPGADRRNLKNREKVAVIDAMKNKYPLPKMLRMMELSTSSYYYQVNARAREDKYALVRIEIKRIFKDIRSRYGYRRIHAELKKIGIGISEKIVRRLMKEEEMKVKKRGNITHIREKSHRQCQIEWKEIFTAMIRINCFYRISVSFQSPPARYIFLPTMRHVKGYSAE